MLLGTAVVCCVFVFLSGRSASCVLRSDIALTLGILFARLKLESDVPGVPVQAALDSILAQESG